MLGMSCLPLPRTRAGIVRAITPVWGTRVVETCRVVPPLRVDAHGNDVVACWVQEARRHDVRVEGEVVFAAWAPNVACGTNLHTIDWRFGWLQSCFREIGAAWRRSHRRPAAE